VIHRDIKPGNLFLCDTGQVKVTDFGIARAIGGATLSTGDTLPGTVAYLPPERWRGEPPAFSNDIPASTAAASPTASPSATSTPVVPIPDVVGMGFARARLLLVDDGFRVLGRHTRVGQIVTRTNPSGQALAGSVVIVVYRTGAVIASVA
jgi:serine/threonine protein kinase